MESYKPHHESFKRAWDFRVEYEFLPLDSQVRYTFVPTQGEPHRLIYQGSRFNFRYSTEGEYKNAHSIIWPEFEDKGGFLILGKWTPIEPFGTARMWIVNDNSIEYHRKYLAIGTTGYITDGHLDIAICKVIELNRLK